MCIISSHFITCDFLNYCCLFISFGCLRHFTANAEHVIGHECMSCEHFGQNNLHVSAMWLRSFDSKKSLITAETNRIASGFFFGEPTICRGIVWFAFHS